MKKPRKYCATGWRSDGFHGLCWFLPGVEWTARRRTERVRGVRALVEWMSVRAERTERPAIVSVFYASLMVESGY